MRLVLLLIFLSVTQAYENVSIISPANLTHQLRTSPALFGVPSFGDPLTASLRYVTTSKGLHNGCDPYTKSPSILGSVLLIDRFDCDFVDKVYNAEKAGAIAAIVYDTDETDYYPPIMKDNGNGDSVHIPSVSLAYADGKDIRDQLIAGLNIVVRMQWRIPHPNNLVTWDLWTTSNNDATRAFKNDFDSVVDVLGVSQQFQPWYFVEPGTGADEPGILSGSMCINGNRYCTSDAFSDATGSLQGYPVLVENVRQICLFRYLSQQNQARLWWNYVQEYQESCSLTFAVDCSRRVLTKLGIATAPIDSCVSSSGGLINSADSSSNVVNTILEDMLKNGTVLGIVLPALFVNGEPYRGSPYCPTPIDLGTCGVLQSICSAYMTAPAACVNTGCPFGQLKDDCGQCGGSNACKTSSSGGASAVQVVIVLLVVAVVLLGLGVWWTRRHRQQMRSELDSIIASYMQMDEAAGTQAAQNKRVPLSSTSTNDADDESDHTALL